MSMSIPISFDAALVSAVVGVVGWVLKIAIQKLIEVLMQTMAKVEVFKEKIDGFTVAIAEIEKMKKDLNIYYARLKELEQKGDQNG